MTVSEILADNLRRLMQGQATRSSSSAPSALRKKKSTQRLSWDSNEAMSSA